MSDLSIQPANVQQPKKMSPVKKGALIAGGIASGLQAFGVGMAIKLDGKDEFVKAISKHYGGKGKYAAACALGIGVYALAGAGIGKIVENCKNKKAQKTQAEG